MDSGIICEKMQAGFFFFPKKRKIHIATTIIWLKFKVGENK
uniref:Uncharacterized protein n=1 Tax=Rhizophora mucronata TaxID=61149 RepID=A0A2P2PLM1_RHIMU